MVSARGRQDVLTRLLAAPPTDPRTHPACRAQEVPVRAVWPVRQDPGRGVHEDCAPAGPGLGGVCGRDGSDQLRACHARLPLLRQAPGERVLRPRGGGSPACPRPRCAAVRAALPRHACAAWSAPCPRHPAYGAPPKPPSAMRAGLCPQRLQYAKGKSDAVARLEGATAKGKKARRKQVAGGPEGAHRAARR